MLITTLLHSPSGDSSFDDIVKDNLSLHLDASNQQSYNAQTAPTEWKDISSVNSNKIGTLVGNTQHNNGFGGYFQLDGDGDYIQFASHEDLKFYGRPFTVAFVVRFNSFKGTSVDFRQGNNAEGLNDFNYDAGGGVLGLWSGEKSAVYYSSNFRLTLNTWHHICYVREGSSFKCYLNGVLDKTVSNADFNAWSGKLRLGAAIHGGAMHGGLGTVLCYKNKALNQEDVTQNHKALMQRFQ